MDESEPIIKTYIGKRGKMKGRKFEIILDEDGELLYNKYTWYVCNMYLARNTYINGGHQLVFFHREIIKANNKQEVDHINRNSLDNRKNNLRVVTHQQNSMNKSMQINNTSGHRGVCWHSQTKKWQAHIYLKNKKQSLGLYFSFQEACHAYDKKAQELFGKYLGEVSNELV